MLNEFKTFIMRGNVLDLAVGVIIGAAFGKIVGSLVDDIIMPVVGALMGGLDFSSYFIRLAAIPEGFKGSLDSYADLKAAGVPMLGYGQFATVAVNFVILAFIIFMVIRAANRVTGAAAAAQADAAPPPTPEDVILLREIRDSLKK
jgi:large conductance mechanosensitive channel